MRSPGLAAGLALLALASGVLAAQSTRRPSLPIPTTNNAVAALERGAGAGLYSLLGIDSTLKWGGITRRAFHLPRGARAWRELPPVPGAVGRLAALAFGVRGKVYLLGGYTVDSAGNEKSVPSVDVWNPVTRRWSAGSPIPVAVDDAVGGVWRDSIIVLVTGWHDTDNVAEVQLYDPSRDRWMRGTPFRGTPVFGGTGTVAGDHFLVIGGARRAPGPVKYTMASQAWLGRINPLAPQRIAWDSVAPAPGPPRYRGAALGCGGRIIVAGGTGNPYNYNGIGYDGQPSSPLGDVVAFDVRSLSWRPAAAPGVPTMDHRSLVAFDGHAWLIGGMRAGQQPSATVISWPLAGCARGR